MVTSLRLDALSVLVNQGIPMAEIGLAPGSGRSLAEGRKAAKRPTEFVSLIVAILIVCALAAGWHWRRDLPWSAEFGTGYWLGISGLSCVGLLLLYPLRKRVSALRVFGSVPAWFRIHMFLGAIAPVFILYHARFSVSSMNANVALICMLIVAGSGIIGRFLYVRIHRGVTGRKQEARRLLSDASAYRDQLNEHFAAAVELAEDLEAHIRTGRSGFFSSVFQAFADSRRIGDAQARMVRSIKQGVREMGGAKSAQRQTRKDALRLVRKYCETLREASQLGAFERLFSLWHVVHLPLFFLMLIAAAIHVFAVHQY